MHVTSIKEYQRTTKQVDAIGRNWTQLDASGKEVVRMRHSGEVSLAHEI